MKKRSNLRLLFKKTKPLENGFGLVDAIGDKTWQFSKEFKDKLVKWHGSNFNWGKKYYRGKSVILWDTLRDFKSN